jgi:hypothetical protein
MRPLSRSTLSWISLAVLTACAPRSAVFVTPSSSIHTPFPPSHPVLASNTPYAFPVGPATGSLASTYPNPTVVQFDGTGSNDYGAGAQGNIVAQETVLGSGTTAPVGATVITAQTTNGTTFVTCASRTPSTNTISDWSVSILGIDVTTASPITGHFYRADLLFTSIRGTGAPTLSPSTPAAQNVRSSSLAATVEITIATNTIEVQVEGVASTTIDWSCILQEQRVQ